MYYFHYSEDCVHGMDVALTACNMGVRKLKYCTTALTFNASRKVCV